MEPRDLVLQYLDEAHATETALVTNLGAHIAMTPDRHHRALLERHLRETREQVENLSRRRAALGGGDGRGLLAAGVGLARGVVGQALVLTKGPLDVVRARGAHERMLKNAKDECATEALEIATYDALEAAARAAGDEETAELAADHRATEERMLADLRAIIPALAVGTFEDRTGEQATGTARRSAAAKASGSSAAKRSAAARKAAQTRRARAAKSSSGRSPARTGGSRASS